MRYVSLAVLVLFPGLPGSTQEPVKGLGLLCPVTEGGPAGEVAAREFGTKALGGRELRLEPDGRLMVPGDLRVLWWHCETGPLPAPMQAAQVKRALRDWVGAGHGLFLSGTALSYVQGLGLEPTAPRLSGQGGNDTFVAGILPGAAAKHPIYEGFKTDAPIFLVSAGYPPFADFHGSGGPFGANVIGEAAPDAGEHPFVEYGHGGGRVIAMGWRLPYWGLANNTHRANLERLTGNILRYLAKGEWFAKIEDGRRRALRASVERINPDAVRRAVQDLSQTFPDKYTRGP